MMQVERGKFQSKQVLEKTKTTNAWVHVCVSACVRECMRAVIVVKYTTVTTTTTATTTTVVGSVGSRIL